MARTNRGGSSHFSVALTLPLIAFLLLLCLVGWMEGFLFEYCLWSIVGKDVPFAADIVGGIVTSTFNLPVAIGCWIARLAGYPAPFIH
jgi:hypothetical protein